MKLVTYSDLRKNLAKIMDQAADDHDPVIIARRDGEAMVLLSLDDFSAYQTTRHIVGTPAKRAALDEAMAELDRGERVEVEFDGEAGLFRPIKRQRQAAK